VDGKIAWRSTARLLGRAYRRNPMVHADIIGRYLPLMRDGERRPALAAKPVPVDARRLASRGAIRLVAARRPDEHILMALTAALVLAICGSPQTSASRTCRAPRDDSHQAMRLNVLLRGLQHGADSAADGGNVLAGCCRTRSQ